MLAPTTSLAQSIDQSKSPEVSRITISSIDEIWGKVCLNSTEEATDISLIQLIANPEKFEGKPVSVIGYYHSGGSPFHEYSALFLHKEDFDQRNTDNSLWISLTKGPEIKDGYMRITGIFSQHITGDMESWASGICHVTTFEHWEPRDYLYGRD